METKLTKEQLEKVARLAALKLTAGEKEQYARELTEIIDYNNSLLDQVNVDGVEPTAHIGGLSARLREDDTAPSLTQDEALKNAPQTKDGFFKVPQILDGE